MVARGRSTTGDRAWVVPGLLGALALAVVTAAWLAPDASIYAHAAEISELGTYPVLLVCAALLYFYSRLTLGEGPDWLATAAVFGTASGVGLAAMRIVMEDRVRERPVWMLLSQLAVAGILCLLLAASDRIRVPMDPMLLGLSLALAVMAARLSLVQFVEPATSLSYLTPALGAGLIFLYVAMGALLIWRVPLPAGAGWHLAGVVGVLGLAQALTYPVPESHWRSLLAVILDLSGATLLAVTSIRLVRRAVTRTDLAEEQVRRLEAHVRGDKTLLHEIAGTVAGISAASRLLSLATGLDRDERRRLGELLLTETARVDRLLHASVSETQEGDPADVDLDALLDSVLFSHGIRGRVVAWHPTGDHVLAREDQLREVLDLLIDNAARHGRTPVLAITLTRRDDQVDVAVVDRGPGIPPEIASSVLEWGTRGKSSTGQGIGLNVAQGLVAGMGGRLRIESERDVGTRVVVTLPVAEVASASSRS